MQHNEVVSFNLTLNLRSGIDVFTVEEAHLASRKRITAAEFDSLRTLAMVATDGYLKAPLTTGKLLPFMTLLRKQAIMRLLKKYPAHEARHCANCSAASRLLHEPAPFSGHYWCSGLCLSSIPFGSFSLIAPCSLACSDALLLTSFSISFWVYALLF